MIQKYIHSVEIVCVCARLCVVKYFYCAVEKLCLVLNDLCTEYLRDGLEFVFSPFIIPIVVNWAQNTNRLN